MVMITENLQEAFPRYLQDEAMRILIEREITHNELADKLDIFPDGARRLLSQNSWPAETGFRVLDALGVTVNVFVE